MLNTKGESQKKCDWLATLPLWWNRKFSLHIIYLTKHKMAAAAILNLSFLFILVKQSISGGNRLHHRKISFIYVNRRPRYCCLCKNPIWRPPPSWILFLLNILEYLHVGPPK